MTDNLSSSEQAVVGAILIDSACLSAISSVLSAADFAFAQTRAVYEAASALSLLNEPINAVTIQSKAKEQGNTLSNEYLCGLMEATPTAANAELYARLVKKDSNKRALHRLAGDIDSALEDNGEPDEVAAMVHTVLAELDSKARSDMTNSANAIQAFYDYRADFERSGKQPIVKTCYDQLDRMLGGGLVNGGLYVVGARPGIGKAQPLNSKILTISGYKKMRDIVLGDSVATETGDFAKVVGIYPQGAKEVYKVGFSDGGSCECTDEHLWTVQNRHDRLIGASRTVRLKDMMGLIKIHADNRLNWSVQFAEPTNFPKRKLLLDPYLMGSLLGDGGFTGESISWTNTEPDVIQRFKDKLPHGDTAVQSDISWRIKRAVNTHKPSETKSALIHYDLFGKYSHEKHIPKDYLLSDAADRLDLLRGLCDTDGFVVGSGTSSIVEYSTASKQLAEDIRFLAQSLGGRCSLQSRMGAYTKSGVKKHTQRNYRVLIHMPENLPPVASVKHMAKYKDGRQRNVRYISGIEYVGVKECQCIKVDTESGLYVTDDYIVTHNTSMGMCLADNIASNGMPTLFVSLEMTRLELTAKRLARESGVPYNTTLMGKLGNEEYQKINKIASALSNSPVIVTDKPRMTLNDIALAARRVKGLRCIVVDYFGLITPMTKAKSRYEQYTEIIDDMKRLAKTLNIPIICLAQLNRENEARSNKRPMLSDLRETGAVEQSADAVIFLHRESYYSREETNEWDSESLEVIVAKNRHGRTGKIDMMWFGPTGRIYEQT